MDLMRIFSLKSRTTFFLLVAALCLFSVGAWWAVRLLVWSEVAARMVSDANRIESALKERISSHANNLVHFRGQFALNGVPEPARFAQLISAVDFVARYPGSLGVGYAPVLGTAQLAPFEAAAKRFNPQYAIWPSGRRDLYVPISMIEPTDWRNKEAQGYDLYSEARRRRAIDRAIRTGEVSLSDPVELLKDPGEAAESGFSLYAALYNGGFNPRLSREDPYAHVAGVLFTPFRVRDFFEGAFGAPSLQQEIVNFVLLTRDPASPSELYNRFGVSEKTISPWMTVERPISLFGQQLLLKVYPLPHFYSFADRYLALFVGLGAALLSCLVMVVMRVSQNQLEFETLAKEASMEAAQQSRRQVENLRRLNEFDQSLGSELELQALVEKFAGSLRQFAQLDASFLYFRTGAQVKNLTLEDHHGLEESELKCPQLAAAWLDRLFTQTLVIRKGGPGADDVLKSLLVHPEQFSDWMLSVVSTRESGRCGLLFTARRQQHFSEVDRELFESMLSQFASSVEIAQLFSRVEDASRAKNAFLANMSHEIRTPLSAIIGFSDILTKEGVSPEQRQSVAESVRKNGAQLTCIIDDILDLSKVEAGKLKIERQRTSLASVVHEIKSLMDLRAHEKGISFVIEGVGRLPSQVETDEVRLKQILVNLVGNAIKFTESGTVRLLVRHVQSETGDDALVFTVKDTGIGISDEAQRELFRPFSQGDASNTRRYGGSGLGLALSKRLAQELGGDVTLVESIRGQGSTFEARIAAGNLRDTPWVDKLFTQLRDVTPVSSDAAPRLDGARLLVVEDSEDNQDIFRFFLEESGASTDFVGNGLKAVEMAAQGSYDMILMDIQIPGIDGKEATRRIRRQGYQRPIVALTAHAMVEEQESCRQAGCSGQITKPVSGEALISQVAGYLGRA